MLKMYLSNSFGPKQRRAVEAGEYAGWLTSFRDWGIPSGIQAGDWWGGDNGCFTEAFNEGVFREWMEKMIPYRERCLFVVAPDILGDWGKTRTRWNHWHPIISGYGYPVAYVGQDGVESDNIPWGEMGCYFVGGTDGWKDKADSLALVREARDRGMRVHVGRANTHRRLSAFFKAYWVKGDPIDGLPGFTFDGNGIRWRNRAELAPAVATLRGRRLL